MFVVMAANQLFFGMYAEKFELHKKVSGHEYNFIYESCDPLHPQGCFAHMAEIEPWSREKLMQFMNLLSDVVKGVLQQQGAPQLESCIQAPPERTSMDGEIVPSGTVNKLEVSGI